MKRRIHSNKKYLALFYDKCEMLMSQFNDAEIGEILKGAIKYELYGEKPELEDRALSVMCSALCVDVDIMTQKANEKSKSGRDSAYARWGKIDKSAGMTEAEMDAEIDEAFPHHKNW